jgi:hypothetical protein
MSYFWSLMFLHTLTNLHEHYAGFSVYIIKNHLNYNCWDSCCWFAMFSTCVWHWGKQVRLKPLWRVFQLWEFGVLLQSTLPSGWTSVTSHASQGYSLEGTIAVMLCSWRDHQIGPELPLLIDILEHWCLSRMWVQPGSFGLNMGEVLLFPVVMMPIFPSVFSFVKVSCKAFFWFRAAYQSIVFEFPWFWSVFCPNSFPATFISFHILILCDRWSTLMMNLVHLEWKES